MNRTDFGTANGQRVEQFTLAAGRLAADVLTYGGIVRRLLVDGVDVVLGFDDLGPYTRDDPRHPYFGCITGRVAGRITAGRFTLDGDPFELEQNDPPNHLHGGTVGLDRRVWQAEPDGDAALRLTHRSPAGDQGYPGNLDVAVTYRVGGGGGDALTIEYEATTDAPTPVNLTNHSYFNLVGHDAGDALGHVLQIDAESHVPADDEFTLLGRVEPVAGSGHDFRSPTPVRDRIADIPQRHGTNYVLDGEPGRLREVARLASPDAGRSMAVETTERCMQFYTGVLLDRDGPVVGKNGVTYPRHGGLCLECHGYPDAVNSPNLGDIVLRPGETYRQTTAYRF